MIMLCGTRHAASKAVCRVTTSGADANAPLLTGGVSCSGVFLLLMTKKQRMDQSRMGMVKTEKSGESALKRRRDEYGNGICAFLPAVRL